MDVFEFIACDRSIHDDDDNDDDGDMNDDHAGKNGIGLGHFSLIECTAIAGKKMYTKRQTTFRHNKDPPYLLVYSYSSTVTRNKPVEDSRLTSLNKTSSSSLSSSPSKVPLYTIFSNARFALKYFGPCLDIRHTHTKENELYQIRQCEGAQRSLEERTKISFDNHCSGIPRIR